MPELDGWATLERIRDLADVPVLIVSGQNPAPEKLENLRSGVDAFRLKPVGGPELTHLVEELLAARV